MLLSAPGISPLNTLCIGRVSTPELLKGSVASPLLCACELGDAETVRTLLASADVNVSLPLLSPQDASLPLTAALLSGSAATVRLLISHPALDWTPFTGVLEGDPEAEGLCLTPAVLSEQPELVARVMVAATR